MEGEMFLETSTHNLDDREKILLYDLELMVSIPSIIKTNLSHNIISQLRTTPYILG